MAQHQGDEQKLISLAKQGRQQLAQLWAQERAEKSAQRNRRGWQGVARAQGGPGDDAGDDPADDQPPAAPLRRRRPAAHCSVEAFHAK